MLISTPGLVLHTTPYGEASVVAKVFTRQLGVRSYLIKGVRGPRGRVKQNLLQPLSSVDMVVYDNPHHDLNHIKELAPRHNETLTQSSNQAITHSLRFFMTEVLYKALREEEPMPALWDYIESVGTQRAVSADEDSSDSGQGTPCPYDLRHLPITFLLTVAHHLGLEPLDNYSVREPYFDLQEGRFIAAPAETTLPPSLSSMLHEYLSSLAPQGRRPQFTSHLTPFSLSDRRALIDALLTYYQLHLSGFRQFHSHEILHTILK